MLSAICFNLDQSKILLSGKELTGIKTIPKGEKSDMSPIELQGQTKDIFPFYPSTKLELSQSAAYPHSGVIL